jgi:hypothetical protein
LSRTSTDSSVVDLFRIVGGERILAIFAGITSLISLLSDSISGHHLSVWEGILRYTPSLLIRDEGCRCWKLNATHTAGMALLAEAGVPETRAEHPVLTGIRHDHLLNETEIERVVGSNRFRFNPYKRTPDWFPSWFETLERAAKVDIPEDILEPSVVLLNQGAHWKANELGDLEEADLLETYEEMVSEPS